SNCQSAIRRCTPKAASLEFWIVLVGTSTLDFPLLDPELLADAPRLLGGEHASIVADQGFDQGFGDAILTDSGIEDGAERRGVLSARDGRCQHGPRKILKDAHAVDHATSQPMHVQIADIHRPDLMPAFGSEGHVGLGTDGASPLEGVGPPIDGQLPPTSRAGELDANLLEGRADAVGTDLRVLRKLLDGMNGPQVSFSELGAGVRAIRESRQLLLGKVPEESMHGVA